MAETVRDPASISPTAHYTSYVWVRHGLSPEVLATPRGRTMYWALAWFHWLGRLATGGGTLETGLLQRHMMIDFQLAAAIEDGRIGQVVEIASGLTGRGLRFMDLYRDRGLTYVEGDLAAMADHKRQLLDDAGLRGPGHHVVTADALRDDGPHSLMEGVRPLLDPARGTALITEGLLSYYPRHDVEGMWARFAPFLKTFPQGVYLSDMRLAAETQRTLAVKLFRWGLAAYASARSGLEFIDVEDCRAALMKAGFTSAELHHPRDMAHIPGLPQMGGSVSPRALEAWVG